jgi:mannonate dehydratase
VKLGLGLYRHQLTRQNFDFARQCGATHLIVHLVDYFKKGADNPDGNQPTGGSGGWGVAGDPDALWSVEEMAAIKRDINDAGLEWEAIENLDPAHWHDVLLDGPRREKHIGNIQTIVRRMGEVGIPTLGYNFTIAGVASRVTGPFARGGAISVGADGVDETPISNGMVWNMVYDANAPRGVLPEISHDELWRRLEGFLEALLPVAEEAGVKLAAHPDDPPMPRVRRQPRLVYQHAMYQRLIDINPSPANNLEFCVGTLGEMTEGDIYETVDHYSKQGRVAYVHLRNVIGKAPHYKEAFIDDGDIDMARVLAILDENGFDGVVIPDHTPQMSCDAPWHAGMAHALGFVAGVLKRL